MNRFILTLLIFCTTLLANAQEYDFLDKDLKRVPAAAFGGSIRLTAPAFLYDGTSIKPRELQEYMFNPELKISFFGVNEGKWKLKAIVFEKESPELVEEKRKRYNRRNGEDPLLNKVAPDFQATDLAGNKVELSAFRGKLVVLNFWFIGCKPCIMEMPDLNELVKEYEKEDIVFLAIGLDRLSSIDTFLANEKFDYRIIPEGRTIAHDYDVYAYPTHFVLDKDGVVVFSQTGYSSNLKRTLKKQLKELLK
ncbi:peroxiredoxin [Roseivirga sp. E12]|uniref:peroxiredoxin family protein n=1 Tax=Roseivirga sp. E12 TaxID=2819237 RepID=UPI001ABC6EBB|nr:TlpA disulfide reductase family protein [Roseivirga sp. E12]MBO3699936.1 TlpA family protein disulfide reductase [Roseivirga sp. E12]